MIFDDDRLYDEAARDVRRQLFPSLLDDAAAPLDTLTRPHSLRTLTTARVLRVTTHEMIPFHVWGVTTLRGGSATIWLNAEAWPELVARVGRTFFTVAHEISHVFLEHGAAIDGLDRRLDLELEDALETAANKLAARLLIPRAAAGAIGHLTPHEVAQRFCVSPRMAEKRLDELRR